MLHIGLLWQKYYVDFFSLHNITALHTKFRACQNPIHVICKQLRKLLTKYTKQNILSKIWTLLDHLDERKSRLKNEQKLFLLLRISKMSIDMGRSKVQWTKQSLFMLEHLVNKAISQSKYPYSFPWQKSCLEDFMKLEWRPCLRKIWYFRKVRDSPRDLIPCPSITLPVANLDNPLQPGKPSNIHIRNPLQLALYHFWNRSPYQLGISFNNEL